MRVGARLLFAALGLVLTPSPAPALTNLYDGFVILREAGTANRFYDLDPNTRNADFHGRAIHITQGHVLFLGAQMETDEGGGGPAGADRAELFYEVGGGQGFTNLDLPFSTNPEPTTDRWEESGGGMVEIGSGLSTGVYQLSVFGRAEDTNNADTVYLNRDGIPGQNFEASIHVWPTGKVMKVMTFNLRYLAPGDGDNSWTNANQEPERRDVVVTVITNHQPDLIGFQEGEDPQLDFLDAALPDYYALERQRPSGGSGNEFSAFAYNTNALELLDRGVISLGNSPGGGYWNNSPDTPFDPFDYFPDMGLNFPRISLWGQFEWRPTGQTFHFHTTHFDFNNGPQVSSATLMTDNTLTRNERMPLSPLGIVIGDFNSTQTDDDWDLFTGTYTNNGITGDFTDSWLEVYAGWTDSGTIHGFNGGVIGEDSRIDWILHRGGFTAGEVDIIYDSVEATVFSPPGTRAQYPSDHYPVTAKLLFPDHQPDFDRDGLPDALELASSISQPADPDTDDDGLLDGQEDIDGDGVVEGGESDPLNGTDTQNPTDIRNYQMDGILDFTSGLLATHGLHLYWQFDGRYLYVATEDAGEGNDHFIFIATNPATGVSAPWDKSGQVGQYAAYLADEDSSGFSGWFDASGSAITNPTARAATYFENGGWLEGVIDLGSIFAAGFTGAFHLAAAPYGSANGGTLVETAQVPTNHVTDGNMLGTNEYVRIAPGDIDQNGINDYADPDQDGDGLANAWETAFGLDPTDASGANGANGDPDNDGADNLTEQSAHTHPNDGLSVFRILSAEWVASHLALEWPEVHGNTYIAEWTGNIRDTNASPWTAFATNTATTFPISTNSTTLSPTNTVFVRVKML